ncbi:hypothetical protein [Meridianimarinicoccus aquatilis]|uniref:hypothetical protein n=1 Tax=Meridianimarinicoccus aquatilis TaxID=2552766 RepID=UPI001FB79836|nr:hypothetical protein [Fluviibacterium aquatile]
MMWAACWKAPFSKLRIPISAKVFLRQWFLKIALGLSGFIGRSLAEVSPVTALTGQMDLSAMPGRVFLALLPVLITVGGQVA